MDKLAVDIPPVPPAHNSLLHRALSTCSRTTFASVQPWIRRRLPGLLHTHNTSHPHSVRRSSLDGAEAFEAKERKKKPRSQFASQWSCLLRDVISIEKVTSHPHTLAVAVKRQIQLRRVFGPVRTTHVTDEASISQRCRPLCRFLSD